MHGWTLREARDVALFHLLSVSTSLVACVTLPKQQRAANAKTHTVHEL